MTINYFTHDKWTTPNPNVPRNAELIGRVSYMSGEIIYDYYCLRYDPAHPLYGHWAFWKVCDWAMSTPEPTCVAEMIERGIMKEYWNEPPAYVHNGKEYAVYRMELENQA